MGEVTKIQWCDHTFNPWRGCTKVAEGCKHCYADAQSKRNPGTLGVWGPNGTRVMAAENSWREPRKWNQAAERDGVRRRVFCASLADVFEEWDGAIADSHGERIMFNRTHGLGPWQGMGQYAHPARMDDLRVRLFELIDATPWLDWLLLTKRPESIRRMWVPKSLETWNRSRYRLFRDNVWLLTSVATQADADTNVPELLKCRDLVPVLGVSAEPLIEAVDFRFIPHRACGTFDSLDGRSWDETEPDGKSCYSNGGLDWIIVGGESGPHARQCRLKWVNALVNQCHAAGVACFVKQLGARACYVDGEPNGALVELPLRHAKGGDWNEWPDDLRVREFPRGCEVTT